MQVKRAVAMIFAMMAGLGSAQAQDTTVAVMHDKLGNSRLTQSLALSSMAKAHGADVAVRVTSLALEVVGLASGPIRAELEKLWRDAKLTQIYEGTNQLNRLEVFHARCNGETLSLLPRLGGSSVASIAEVNGG